VLLKNAMAVETEDDNFAHPMATATWISRQVDRYKTFYYVLTWVRIVLSFILWVDRPRKSTTTVHGGVRAIYGAAQK
jgi:hypothetical protein